MKSIQAMQNIVGGMRLRKLPYNASQLTYKACVIGKYYGTIQLSMKERHATKFLEIVHLHVFRLMKTTSLDGARN